MKTAILTMFNGLSSAYSLVNVVAGQIKMLLDAKIEIKVLVSEHCPDDERKNIFADERIQWVKIVNSENGNQFMWEDYSNENIPINETFFHEAELIAKDFEKALFDVDVCFMHDILYQGLHLIHNVAIRKAQKNLPNVKFLSFTHSAPVPHKDLDYPKNCLYSKMPNTKYIYPSKCGIPMLMKQYNILNTDCAEVNNSINLIQGLHSEVSKINEQMDLSKKDILIVYPARMSMAKGFHLLSEFAGVIKRISGKSIGIIFCDFPSSDICPIMYKAIIRDLGEKAGLLKDDMIFTTDIGYNQGISREAVLDLFSLSNLFICPSFSESFGLIVLEAASKGNFVVVNENVFALKELGDKIGAYPMRWAARNFDKITYERYEPSEKEYFEKHAKIIIGKMYNTPAIIGKTITRVEFSPSFIFENQLKPLLEI